MDFEINCKGVLEKNPDRCHKKKISKQNITIKVFQHSSQPGSGICAVIVSKRKKIVPTELWRVPEESLYECVQAWHKRVEKSI